MRKKKIFFDFAKCSVGWMLHKLVVLTRVDPLHPIIQPNAVTESIQLYKISIFHLAHLFKAAH